MTGFGPNQIFAGTTGQLADANPRRAHSPEMTRLLPCLFFSHFKDPRLCLRDLDIEIKLITGEVFFSKRT